MASSSTPNRALDAGRPPTAPGPAMPVPASAPSPVAGGGEQSAPGGSGANMHVLDLPDEAIARILHFLLPRSMRADSVSHGKTIACFNVAAWLREDQGTHVFEPYQNPQRFLNVLPTLLRFSSVCRAFHRVMHAYVSRTDIALAGPRFTTPFGFADKRLEYHHGFRTISVPPEIKGWKLPVRFLDDQSAVWGTADKDALRAAAESVTALALNPRISMSNISFDAVVDAHVSVLDQLTFPCFNATLRKLASYGKTAGGVHDGALSMEAPNGRVPSLFAAPDCSSVRHLHIKTEYDVWQLDFAIEQFPRLERGLSSFIIEFSPTAWLPPTETEPAKRVPLHEIHWRWNASPGSPGIELAKILCSLRQLCCQNKCSWKDVVSWNVPRICRLKASAYSELSAELKDRFHWASVPFPELDISIANREETMALMTFFRAYASKIRVLNLRVYQSHDMNSRDYLLSVLEPMEECCAVEDFSFEFVVANAGPQGSLEEYDEAGILIQRLLVAFGKRLEFFDIKVVHDVDGIFRISNVMIPIYKTAKRENPNLKIFTLNLFWSTQFFCLPMNLFLDESDVLPELEFEIHNNPSAIEKELLKCQDALRSIVKHMPRLRTVSGILSRRDPYAVGGIGYSDEEFYYNSEDDVDFYYDDPHEEGW